jgi:phosphatidylglycerol:prolipoprotein diacylglycerol transferase
VHPVLIRTPWIDLHTYGFLVAAAFLVGIALAARRAKTEALSPQTVTDLGVWLVIAGMAGGKLFHILLFWPEFIAGWRAEGLRSLREGFVFYGGFICATVAGIVYARRREISFWKLADLFAPCIALGHAIGRLGCFFNGCCYGKACALPWAVRFPEPHLMAGVGVHPTQLYEAAGNLAIFAGLSMYRRHKRFNGQLWWLYMLSYGALRFLIEFFRGDYQTYYIGVFTVAHFIAAAMIVAALVGLFYDTKDAGHLR